MIYDFDLGIYNVCSPNPCQNGGMCSAVVYGGFKCYCPVDYKGTYCESRYRMKWH